ncbi:MAG: septal ring lytic transglycosylase RlpA family protein [Candidatus Cloacimonetes bacterium]|nr:septal ring lytic transglycosylase RlpA family protein [Candidatus Cloacimonadota bacterium]
MYSLLKKVLCACVLFCAILLLTSCSSAAVYSKGGNRPAKSVHQPKETAAVPKGKSSYMVTSWYGNAYHGKQTASGEIFNMYDYTAAHKTLPFGTKLKLINELNNKEVVVTVNDRGPFIKGRDLDVSYKTAQTLDFAGLGVCKLKVIYLD